MTQRYLKILLASASLTMVLLGEPASAQFAVIDHANLVANLREAADEVREINNQIESLNHEITMIQDMSRDLQSIATSPLGSITTALTGVSTIMDSGTGIPFDVDQSISTFNTLWPQTYPGSTTATVLEGDAQGRWLNTMKAFLQTLSVQAQIAKNVSSDTGTLSQIVTASQGAVGNLEVTQAGNQLLALSTKQQLQTQSLMAAQYRADALRQADEAEADEEARTEFTNFLGSGTAYTEE
jgi:P-type conjugative transfer protein TrbJ